MRNRVLFLLLLAQQMWVFKVGPLSVAVGGFILSSLLLPNFSNIPRWAYLYSFLAALSVFLSGVEMYSDVFQYTRLFSLIDIAIFILFLNLCLVYRDWSFSSRNIKPIFLCMFLSVFFAAIVSPQILVGPQDGLVGLFNEKGMYAYYISLMSIVFLSINRSWLGFFVFLLVMIYVVLIVQASRVLLLYLVLGLMYLQNSRLMGRIFACLFVLLFGFFILGTNFSHELVVKLSILASGEGVIGRYAAAALVAQMNTQDLIYGHGFGSYLNYRAFSLDLPDGADYDYPGSFILEMIFEIGVPATVVLIIAMAKTVFRKITIFTVLAIVFMTAIGGKHDVQMLSGIIVMGIVYVTLFGRNMGLKV